MGANMQHAVAQYIKYFTPTRKCVFVSAHEDRELTGSCAINRIGDRCFEIIYTTL